MLDPPLNTTPKPRLQSVMPRRHPCYTWNINYLEPTWNGKSQLSCSQQSRMHILTSSIRDSRLEIPCTPILRTFLRGWLTSNVNHVLQLGIIVNWTNIQVIVNIPFWYHHSFSEFTIVIFVSNNDKCPGNAHRCPPPSPHTHNTHTHFNLTFWERHRRESILCYLILAFEWLNH